MHFLQELMERNVITDYLDSYLEIGSLTDDSANGLQVENSGTVDRIGLAVDACHESITKAAQAGCNLLVVHHGLYWGRQELVLDHHYQRIRDLIIADMALYTAHIPLDAHPEIGHNRVIAEHLELVDAEPFALYHGRAIGVKGRFNRLFSRTEAASEVEKVIGCRQGFLTFGPDIISTAAIVAGSATDTALFRELKREGIDLFITGEPKHGAFHLAREFGLNIFYGGHYQTETFGMKALGEHLHKRFSIPVSFVDAPCIF